MRFTYGVWEQTVVDARAGAVRADDPHTGPSFGETFAEFNSGNPILALVSDRGFGLFSGQTSLAAVLRQHHESLVRHSCGRCTPCRVGSRLLLDALALACAGQGARVDWETALAVAVQMRETSLCGIGRTGVTPFIGALTHFPELLRTAKPVEPAPGACSIATSPCIEACPAHIEVPRYVDAVRDGRVDRAVRVMLEHYPLVGSCGRICVRYCERACRRRNIDAAVAIRSLKRFAADANPVRLKGVATPPAANEKAEVAIIGAGPAGLACAYHLLLAGHTVDVFEAAPAPGGMARYGIPAYRLPKDVLGEEIRAVADLGGRFFYNKALGRDMTIDGLEADGYNAVFLGIGASLGQLLHLPEDADPPAGYENGIDFLRRVHDGVEAGALPALHGDVVVVGGGNVAMDCCRSAARLTDGKVHVLYRRTEADLPADREEVEEAGREGVEFHFLTLPAGLETANGVLTGVTVRNMRQGEPDASGRRSVSPIAGSEWTLPCAHLIAAIGQRVRADDIPAADGLAPGRNGTVSVDGDFATSRPRVFAGGDCASGPDTLIGALMQGERAAQAMLRVLESGGDRFSPRWRMSALLRDGDLLSGSDTGWEPSVPRQRTPALPPAVRKHSFAEVELPLRPEKAMAEARRCLRCYRLFTVVTGSPVPNTGA